MSCGAETEANTLLAALLQGEDVTLPPIDYDADYFRIPEDILTAIKAGVTRLTPEEITTGELSGSGVFDRLMRGMKSHLQNEYDKNRITGAEYTKAYIATVEGAMSNAIQFLINRDQAFWQAQTAQLAALTARMQFETTKMQLATAKFEALTAKSNYGLTKMKISTESLAYCTGQYQLEELMPLQKTQLEKQNLLADKQIDTAIFNLDEMLPAQRDMVLEQVESQRAQTADTRTDGAAVLGLLGKQKDLYNQQIISYQRDAEVKAAKLFTDAWITMKTIDEGLEPPTNFTNAQLNVILSTLIDVNDLGEDVTP